MNLKRLQLFVTVARLGSATAAAQAHDSSQPLVSRQIALLEAQWGGHLFERSGRGLVLSPFGQRMLPEVEALLEQVGRVESAAAEIGGVPTGKVLIGLVPSIARPLVPSLVRTLTQSAPGIQLQIREGFSGQLEEFLLAGKIDIAVLNRYSRKVLPHDDIVGRDAALLVSGPKDPLLREGGTWNFDRLAGLPLVLPHAPNEFRVALDHAARKAGIHLSVVLEVDNLRAMKEAALSGYGYTILSSLGVHEDIRAGALSGVRIVRPSLPRTTVLAVSTSRPLSLAGRMVLSTLHAMAPRLIRSPLAPV